MQRNRQLGKIFAGILGAGALLFIQSCANQDLSDHHRLNDRLAAFIENHATVPGVAVVAIAPDQSIDIAAAAGVASPDGVAMTADTPVRLASTTKTYVAATFLRLYEQGRVDIDAPIASLIAPDIDALLSDDGYKTDTITPRHLLMHTSGLPDHAGDDYAALIFEDPSRQWTRRDQIALGMANHDPLGPPNSTFEYSDTGYVILGHIVERAAGKDLAAVVREQLRFDALGLASTWWEQAEQAPSAASPRAHQYLGDVDTHGWNGSMDMYGGGGLIASMRDTATFFLALMQGEIFERPETLDIMLDAPGHPFPDQYRIGVFPIQHNGYYLFEHGGFWGTHALYVRELNTVVAGVVLEQSAYGDLRKELRRLAMAVNGRE